MKKLYLFAIVLLLICSEHAFSQTTISGTIKGPDGALPGVNIVVKGSVAGTITNTDGQFNLRVNQSPPFTLSISMVGFKTQEKEITDATSTLDLAMEEETLLGQEIVVSSTRYPVEILKSPVTIEKM